MIYILDTYGNIMLIYQVKQIEFFGRGEDPLAVICAYYQTKNTCLPTLSYFPLVCVPTPSKQVVLSFNLEYGNDLNVAIIFSCRTLLIKKKKLLLLHLQTK